MRFVCVLILCLTFVSCAGQAGQPPQSKDLVESTSTTLLDTTSTTRPTTTSTLLPPPSVDPVPVLRADGIAAFDFGTHAEEASAGLVELFGPPDQVSDEPTDCYASVEQVQIMEWDEFGLRVVFTDWGGDWVDPVAVPLHLSDWEVWEPAVTTVDGLGPGTTVAELRALYPDVLLGINEFAPSFIVEEAMGRFMGGFDWQYEEFDAALQRALDERGFETGGELGAGTGQALLDFIDSQDLHDAVDVLTHLDLPPSDIAIGWMHGGTGPLCD